jgi:patatin-like phospholipase/acyl hydrolase
LSNENGIDDILKNFKDRENIFDSKHSSYGLSHIKEKFGDVKLSEALSTVLIPAYDLGETSPYLFNSHDARVSINKEDAKDDFLMGDVAMATSAAPTFFPPVEIPHYVKIKYSTRTFVDGRSILHFAHFLGVLVLLFSFQNSEYFLSFLNDSMKFLFLCF